MKRSFPTPKLSLVTGAANGLGCEIARMLLTAGGRVICIDRDEEQLHHLQSKFPETCIAIVSDLADLDNIENLIPQIVDQTNQFGLLNLVLFNAGISATGRFEMLPSGIHENIINLNATSPMLMASSMMREKLMNEGSAMVFISSLSHQTGYPGAASYAASKDAIAIYAKSIRKDYSRHKVHVMSVFPGPIRTKMAERHSPEGANSKKRMPPKKIARRILQAASRGQTELFPDLIARFSSVLGRLMPHTMTKIMRKIIFEKLDKEIY